MAPPRKTNPEQTTWLNDRIPAFRQAQKDTETGPWGLLMCQEWYAEWPIEDEVWGTDNWPPLSLSPEDKEKKESACAAKQKQLITWFRNNSKSTGIQKSDSAPAAPKGKSKRALQEVEVYSKLYYKTKVQSTVDEELANLKAVRNVSSIDPPERLKIVREHTKTSLQQESEEVKKKVAEAYAEEKERTRALALAYKRGIVEEEGRSPEQYQHAIDTAPRNIRKALDPIAAASGCIYTVVLSGPMPVDGGAIGSLSVHSGLTVTGHNFADVTPHYREEFVRPHVRFAKGLFAADVRRQRALPPTSTGLYRSDEVEGSPRGPSTSPATSQTASLAASREKTPEADVIATPSVILDERDKHTGLGSSLPLQEGEMFSGFSEVRQHGEGGPLIPDMATLGSSDPLGVHTWSAGTANGAAMDAGWGPMYNMSGAQLTYGNAPVPFSYHTSGSQLSVGPQLTGLNMCADPQLSFGDQLVDFDVPASFGIQTSNNFSYNELFMDLGPLVPTGLDRAGALPPVYNQLPSALNQPQPPAAQLEVDVLLAAAPPMPITAAAPSCEPPAPSCEPPAPSSESPAPSSEPPAPSSESPAPSSEPPAPSSKPLAPAPSCAPDFIEPLSAEPSAEPEAQAVITTRTGRVSRARPAADGSIPSRPGTKPKPRPVNKDGKSAAEGEHPEVPAAKRKKPSS